MHYTLTDFFKETNLQKPLKLDYITLKKEDITFKVYGVLHALTGGTNREYVKLVNDSITQERKKGVHVLAEKSMKKMYKGINQEVEDWLQMPFKDIFLLTSKILLPQNLKTIIFSIFKEKFQSKDRFSLIHKRLQDIGGSAYFHLLNPEERRLIAGFPDAKEYLKQNMLRLNSKKAISAPVFPDKDWSWLTVIEPHTNIPARSIHMFEYAYQYAKKHNIKEIALFVGEVHNSDINWYINEFKENDLDAQEKETYSKIIKKSKIPFTKGFSLSVGKIKYLTASFAAAIAIMSLYAVVGAF